MDGARNETILAQERLHPAIFIVPAFVAVATALPASFMLLTFHEFTTLVTDLLSQVFHQQFRLFDGWLYALLLLPTLILTGPVLLVTWVAYSKSTVTLTDRRLTYRTGLISIVKGELPLENVDAIVTVDPLLGRLFGFGTVVVTSVGGLRLPFFYIRSPHHFYQVLNKAVNKVKRSPEKQPEPEPEPAGKGKATFAPQNKVENDDSRYMPKG